MELRKGYKRIVDVGVIPEDWDVKPLLELCVENGLVRGPFGGSLKKECFVESGIKVYEQKNAIEKSIEIGSYFVDSSKFGELKRFEVFEGDFIVSCSGTIGKIFQIPHGAPKGIINQALLRIKTDDKVVDAKYFLLYFDWGNFQERIIDNTQGGAMKNLVGMSIFRNTSIALPPTKSEQAAIATALSDVDALISKLEELLTKKRNIKQGAMQQLLTGKKRLPGFMGEWEVKRLGDVLKIRHGKSQKGIRQDEGKYPILATSGEIDRTNSFLYDKPSVLIGRKGTIDYPQYIDTPFWTIDTLFYSEIFPSAVPKYIFYYFQTINWLGYNEASGVPSLNASTIENIELQCPQFPEQTAIAQVLNDMDAEIEGLERKLTKYKLIKQGMLQELLTGQKRLI